MPTNENTNVALIDFNSGLSKLGESTNLIVSPPGNSSSNNTS